jgi:hypothetical protein
MHQRSLTWKTTALLSALAVTALISGFATPKHTLCEGFLPENTMKIPVGWKMPKSAHQRYGLKLGEAGGITLEQYNQIMDRVEKFYTPIVSARGGQFVVNRLWDDATVNSNATQQGNQWIINMFGGVARHPAVTVEGETLIACHETGHHLGGAPKYGGSGGGWGGWGGNQWATNEGGADYFSAVKCMRFIFAQDDNEAIIAKATIDPLARQQCERQFATRADQLICLREALAGQSIAYLFQDIRKETTLPRFDTPDTTQVDQTFDSHPGTQCRLDTYFAAAICHVDKSAQNSDSDYRQGSCVQGVDDVGYRPRCWFKPDASLL